MRVADRRRRPECVVQRGGVSRGLAVPRRPDTHLNRFTAIMRSITDAASRSMRKRRLASDHRRRRTVVNCSASDDLTRSSASRAVRVTTKMCAFVSAEGNTSTPELSKTGNIHLLSMTEPRGTKSTSRASTGGRTTNGSPRGPVGPNALAWPGAYPPGCATLSMPHIRDRAERKYATPSLEIYAGKGASRASRSSEACTTYWSSRD